MAKDKWRKINIPVEVLIEIIKANPNITTQGVRDKLYTDYGIKTTWATTNDRLTSAEGLKRELISGFSLWRI